MKFVGALPLAAALACAAPRKTVIPAAAPSQATTKVAPAAPSGTRVAIRLATPNDVDDRIHVEIELEGPIVAQTKSFGFHPLHEASVGALSVSDAKGSISPTRERHGFDERIDLGRPAEGRITVRYEISLPPASAPREGLPVDASSPIDDGLRPTAEPVELRALGSDVLLVPEAPTTDAPLPFEIHIHVGPDARGATSFGLGADQTTTARWSDLSRALFLGGDVGTARFHAVDGDDFGAWLGFTAFDPRWVSAEAAGVRAAVDAYVGRSIGTSTPPFSYLFTVNRKNDPPITVRSGPRGLIVIVDRRASWTPRALLLVTQGLVRRYVGDFLHVGNRSDALGGAFFSSGFSRAIARDVLDGMGLLSAADSAHEVNAWLASSVFATDPLELATARGALVATSLDAVLGARDADTARRPSLKSFVRERLQNAAKEASDTLSRDAFMKTVAESVGKSTARRFEAALDQGIEVDLSSDLLGRCYRLVRKQLVPFELGFKTAAGQEMTVLSVQRGSHAEFAGVRVGDVIRELHYEAGASRVPVELTLVRDGKPIRVRFVPAGTPKAGRVFERILGVPDERCGS